MSLFLSHNTIKRRLFLNQNKFISTFHLPISQRILKINNDAAKQKFNTRIIKIEKEHAFAESKDLITIEIKKRGFGFQIYMNDVYFKSVTVLHFSIDGVNTICTKHRGIEQISYFVNNFLFIAHTSCEFVSLKIFDTDIKTKKLIIKCLGYKEVLVLEPLAKQQENIVPMYVSHV